MRCYHCSDCKDNNCLRIIKKQIDELGIYEEDEIIELKQLFIKKLILDELVYGDNIYDLIIGSYDFNTENRD